MSLPLVARPQKDFKLALASCRAALSFKVGKKVKYAPYSITSVGIGADPGFLAVSPQVTLVINPMVRAAVTFPRPAVTFPAKDITAHWPVPSYTAW